MINKCYLSLLMMLVCTTQGCILDNEPAGKALEVGDSLPEFTVTLNNGDVVSTASLLDKVAVIVFFNTGCRDCQEELPVVEELWRHYKDSDHVEIVAISREESASEIEKYWADNGFTMPWSAQEGREVYSLFAPSVIPRIFIANPKGVITFTSGDTNMPSLADLIAACESALK